MVVQAKLPVGAEDAPVLTKRFALLLATQTLFGLSFSTFFLLPKFLKQVLHASATQIGQVSALGSVAGVLAFPLVGALNDRFGRRPFVVLGCAMMTASALAMLQITDIGPLLYLLRVLHGLAFAMLFNSATTLVSDGVSRARVGQALSLFGASLLATHALAPAAAESIAEHAGWPAVFSAAAVCGALSFVISLWVRDEPRAAPAVTLAPSGPLALLARADVRRIVLIIAAAGAGFGTVFTFHQPYALARGVTHVSGFFVAYAVSALLSRLSFVTRIPSDARARISAVAMLGYGAAVFATTWLSATMLIVVGAVMGLAQGMFYPVFNALALECVPARQRGSMMALYHGGFNAGIALSLVVGGAVAAHVGFPVLFCVVALLVGAGAALLGFGTTPMSEIPDSTTPSRHPPA